MQKSAMIIQERCSKANSCRTIEFVTLEQLAAKRCRNKLDQPHEAQQPGDNFLHLLPTVTAPKIL